MKNQGTLARIWSRLFITLCVLAASAYQTHTTQASAALFTSVSGIIWENTTWSQANSPYYVTGDVQVPNGVRLTIEPGVEVRYAGAYEVLIGGTITAAGTANLPILFNGTTAGSNATLLHFANANLDGSSLEQVHFLNAAYAVRVSPGTSGTLHLNNTQATSVKFVMDGGTGGATLAMNQGSLNQVTVQGTYAGGGQINLQGMSLQNSTINSDAYAVGISVFNSSASNSTFLIGCCSAKMHIESSHLENSVIQEGMGQPVTGPLEIVSSQLINTPINLPAAQVLISGSAIQYASGTAVRLGNGAISNTTVSGDWSGTGIEITGNAGYNIGGTTSIQNSVITRNATGVRITGANAITIAHSDLVDNTVYHIENRTTAAISAVSNYWGTTDAAQIAAKLFDSFDDISKGKVDASNPLASPDPAATLLPPALVVKTPGPSGVHLSWAANPETNLAGYRVYSGSNGAFLFNTFVDVGNVMSYDLPDASLSDPIGVTAYDADQHESWFSLAENPTPRIAVLPSSLDFGVVQTGQSKQLPLFIKNTGTGNLTISGLTINNAMYSFSATSFTVTPGQEYQVMVTFAPTAVGSQNGTLTILHNAAGGSLEAPIYGWGSAEPGTGVRGILLTDTTWAQANSPYYITGDVQVPSGVRLTIEPGVAVRYAGDYELLVGGSLTAAGTTDQPILMNGTTAGSNATLLHFANTNLDGSSLDQVHFQNAAYAVRVSPGTSGTLHLNNTQAITAKFVMDAGTSSATLAMNQGNLNHVTVQGTYAGGGQINLQGMSLQNSTINSDAYAVGISLFNSTADSSAFLIGCCSAKMHIEGSHLENSVIQEGMGQPVTGPLEIVSSQFVNTPINLPAAQVLISGSAIQYASGTAVRLGNGAISGTTVSGDWTGTGIEITGNAGYNIGGTTTIQNSVITKNATGVRITGANQITIQHSDFVDNAVYHIENRTTAAISAADIYWGTTDGAQIAAKLFDYFDDISKGKIDYQNALAAPDAAEPLLPPARFVKTPGQPGVHLTWDANIETNVAGYRIYTGAAGSYRFTTVIDVGNVTSYNLPGAAVNDPIGITAYTLDNKESWYALAGNPMPRISVDPLSLDFGVVQTGQSRQIQLSVENAGTGDLTVSSISINNAAYAPSPASFSLAPGQVQPVTVTFSPSATGSQNATLTILHNAAGSSLPVPVYGWGAPESGTSVRGILLTNTTWSQANSPYYVTGDVQVPSGVKLTIEPGVEVRYAGTYEVLIGGSLTATGTADLPILLDGSTSGNSATLLHFANANLDGSSLDQVHFQNAAYAVRVSSGTSGTLHLNNTQAANAKFIMDAGTSNATLLMNQGSLNQVTLQGTYAGGGQITLQGMTLQNSTINSDAYAVGISLFNSSATASTFLIGCCSAKMHIESSHLENSTIQEGMGQPVTGPLEIVSSQVVNTPINLPAAQVMISGSTIQYASGTAVRLGNGSISNTTVSGDGTGTGIEITGNAGYNIGGTTTIQNAVITNNATGVRISGANTVTIQHSDLTNNAVYHIENRTTAAIPAGYNYWGTTDAAQIAAKLFDYFDDISKGKIDYSPLLASSRENPVLGPDQPSVAIQEKKGTTEQPIFGLSLSTSQPASEMLISDDPTFPAQYAWQPFSATVDFPSTGTEYIYTKFRDAAANESAIAFARPFRIMFIQKSATLVNQPVLIQVRVDSSIAVGTVTTFYRPIGTGSYKSIPMDLSDGIYSGWIPKEDLSNGIEYYIQVKNANGDSVATLPDSNPSGNPFVLPVTTILQQNLDSGSNNQVEFSIGLVVSVPAGAISSDTSLQVQSTDIPQLPDGMVGAGQSYSLTMADATSQFNKPVTLTFSYNQSDLRGDDPANLRGYYVGPDGSVILAGGAIDTADRTLSLETAHFTHFFLARGKAIYPAPPAAAFTGRDLTLKASMINYASISQGSVFYKVGTGGAWKELPMRLSGGMLSATIPASDVTKDDLYFYFTGSDGVNSVTYPVQNPQQNPLSVRTAAVQSAIYMPFARR